MKVYVASSWRNEIRQQQTVKSLRDAGHEVYDFRNPAPGDHGFGWRQCATDTQLKDPRAFRDDVLTHTVARAAFAKDMRALSSADATVLVLPCGRSAHLELGWATGARQTTVVLLDDPISEPELMYLACSRICISLDEVAATLSEVRPDIALSRLVHDANALLEAAHYDERVPHARISHAPTLAELRQVLGVLTRNDVWRQKLGVLTRGDVWRQKNEDALRAVINLYYEVSRRSVEAGDEQTGAVLRHGD